MYIHLEGRINCLQQHYICILQQDKLVRLLKVCAFGAVHSMDERGNAFLDNLYCPHK